MPVHTVVQERRLDDVKIAVASDHGQVAEHFGYCDSFAVFQAEGSEIKSSESVANPGHRPGFLPRFLHDLGVDVIIAGGMGSNAVSIFNECGIEVVIGARGDAVQAAKSYLKGELHTTGSVCHQHEHEGSCTP